MVHMAQDFFGLGNDTYHCVLVGLEAIPSDEMAKKLAILTDMTSNQKKQLQQLQNEQKSLCRPTTMMYSRHFIFRNCGHGKR